MSTEQHQPHADPCLDLSFLEQEDSWPSVEEWHIDFFIPANESVGFPPSEWSPRGASLGMSAYSPGPFIFEPAIDWEPLLEPGFESMETLVEYPDTGFNTAPTDEDLFICPSPPLLILNSPTFTDMTSDGSSWGMSPIQPPAACRLPSPPPPPPPLLSPVSSHEDPVPHIATSNDQWDTLSRPKISPVVSTPSNETPLSSSTEVHTRAPRLSVRNRGLATHNVRVNSQVLKDKLENGGHSDKIEALDSLLAQIGEFIVFRESCGHDRTTRASISPPEVLRSSLFSPFLGKLYVRGKSPATRRTLLYVCVFCEHKLPNRTQIIQHLMAQHLRYFPHECGECDATFCRLADLRKHRKDKHSGTSVACSCGKTFSNQRNYQRHQRLKNGVSCLTE